MKTSKIQKVTADDTWTSSHDQSLMYKYEYTMEDGATLQASHKKENLFQVGDVVEYEITKPDHPKGPYGKVKKPNSFSGKGGKYEADPKKQVAIIAQSSMTKAIDVLLSGVVNVEFKDINDFVTKTEALTDLLIKKQIELAGKHIESYKSK